MLTVKVDLAESHYNIVIGNGILPDLGKALGDLNIGQDAVIITSPDIEHLHGKALVSGLKKGGISSKFFTVPEGEKSKSAARAFGLIEDIAAYNVKKEIFIIAFGGGVIGDLAGYVAAAYKRGIPYVQVPTTFLAQIDSAIGGKVAIDLPCGKNLVGAFYQPRLVWSDTAVLSTLNKRQIKNGLAEAVKYGIISSKNLFEYMGSNVKKLLALDPPIIKEVVFICSRMKANVVMRDEKETRGIRTILNFGHTVGHAIEAASQFKEYHHGEAVALGMRVASDISHRVGLLKPRDVARVNKILSDIGLPEKIKKVSLETIMEHMGYDKKFKAGENRFVLAVEIGSVKVVEEVPHAVIRAAIKKYME